MYTDQSNKPIADNAPYTAPDGTKYPGNFPKSKIPSLEKVKEVAAPKDAIVTGFFINGSANQVWQYRDKTEEEIAEEVNRDILAQIAALEATVTQRRFRDAVSTDQKISDAGKTWINDVETKLAKLRGQLKTTIKK